MLRIWKGVKDLADDKKKKRDPLNAVLVYLCGMLVFVYLLGVLLNMLAHYWWIAIMLAVIIGLVWRLKRERENHAEYRRTHS